MSQAEPQALELIAPEEPDPETKPVPPATMERQPAPVVHETGDMLSVIAAAASDPNVSVEKLQGLQEILNAERDRDARLAFSRAKAKMQPKLPVIEERGVITGKNERLQSSYPLWEDVAEGILPVLGRYGFSLTHRTAFVDGKIHVTGVLTHEEGHVEESVFIAGSDNTGSKNAIQADGSSRSYGARYTAKDLTGFTSKRLKPLAVLYAAQKSGAVQSQDDGGQAGGDGVEYCTAAQHAEVKKLLDERDVNYASFCEFFNLRSIQHVPANDFTMIVEDIKKRPIPK